MFPEAFPFWNFDLVSIGAQDSKVQQRILSFFQRRSQETFRTWWRALSGALTSRAWRSFHARPTAEQEEAKDNLQELVLYCFSKFLSVLLFLVSILLFKMI